jgi:hypothetical protein
VINIPAHRSVQDIIDLNNDYQQKFSGIRSVFDGKINSQVIDKRYALDRYEDILKLE